MATRLTMPAAKPPMSAAPKPLRKASPSNSWPSMLRPQRNCANTSSRPDDKSGRADEAYAPRCKATTVSARLMSWSDCMIGIFASLIVCIQGFAGRVRCASALDRCHARFDDGRKDRWQSAAPLAARPAALAGARVQPWLGTRRDARLRARNFRPCHSTEQASPLPYCVVGRPVEVGFHTAWHGSKKPARAHQSSRNFRTKAASGLSSFAFISNRPS